MGSLSTHYTDYYKLDRVWCSIPAWNMQGYSYDYIGTGEDDQYTVVSPGGMTPMSRSWEASEFSRSIPAEMASATGMTNVYFVRNVFTIYYKECDLASSPGDCQPEGSWKTEYDLEVYLDTGQVRTMVSPEGLIAGDARFNMQIFLGGSGTGLYGDTGMGTRYMFAGRKGGLSGTNAVTEGHAMFGQKYMFGMEDQGSKAFEGLNGGDAFHNDNEYSTIPGWKIPDEHMNAGAGYGNSSFSPYHKHYPTKFYWSFKHAVRVTKVGGFTTPGSTDPCGGIGWHRVGEICVPICGGVINTPPRHPQNPRPTPPIEGPSTGNPNSTGTSMLSCLPCGPCTITSKPYIDGIVNGSGVPTSIDICNTYMHPVSSKMCAALLQIMAPIKQESYRVGQILFWAGIDDSGKLVSLSDPIYTDRVTAITPTTNIMSLPVSMREVTPGNAVSQFNTYDISPLKVYRTQDNLNSVTSELNAPASDHYEEMRMWYLKDSIGRLQFNPVTQKFQNIELTSHQFRTLSRTQTAYNDDQSNYSMLYCPSDGYRVYEPLTLADGSQYIGWKNQGAGYSAGSKICYEVEWHTVSKTLTGYDDTLSLVGGLDSLPIYYPTSNTRSITGRYATFDEGQGMIAMDRELSRPQGRKPVASGTLQLDHSDHAARRYGLYNSQNTVLTGSNSGYLFSTEAEVNELTGRAYDVTKHSYPGTTAPSVTSNRLLFEYKNTLWDIADFSMFTSLSGTDFGLFLHTANLLSLHSPLTADYSALELIGFCTYNGSLTATDGSYYCAAIARGNVPTWCTPITGTRDNFVICTSGCNLVLPYIVYRPYPE